VLKFFKSFFPFWFLHFSPSYVPHASPIWFPLTCLPEKYSVYSTDRETFIMPLSPVSCYTLLVIPNFVCSILLSNIRNVYSFLNTSWFKIKTPAEYFHFSYDSHPKQELSLHLTLTYIFLWWRLSVYCGIGSRFIHVGCIKLNLTY